MALETGHYAQRTTKRVTVWQAPDANGDGDVVWENKTDADGNVLGRMKAKDKDGNELRHYNPPEGFENRPSFDHTDNYVRVDERGRVIRTPSGDSISIAPGRTLVEHPDGSCDYLDDDYSHYLFESAHDKTSAPDTKDLEDPSVKKDVEDPRDARIRELERQLEGKAGTDKEPPPEKSVTE